MSGLTISRNKLYFEILYNDDREAAAVIAQNWAYAKLLIERWWHDYKAWERDDTFNEAVQDDRMTMRSFASDFASQVNKTQNVTITRGRFYDSERKSLPNEANWDAFARMPLAPHQRGIDTSAYANPANFASRQLKYDLGLHDLSVRLVKKGTVTGLKGDSHHKAQENPHFCFLPLSKSEDQFVLYKLMRYAKALRTTSPEVDTLVRQIRNEMTRVKVSSDYDMGTGYTAVPTPGRPDGLAYKVTYGLGSTVKVRGHVTPPDTTKEMLQARQEMYFKSKAAIVKYPDNEIVIAMRKHAGPFPVYAVYDNSGTLKCFDIVNGQKVLNGQTISATGVASW